jgi:DNA-binding MarR family transcriptional regulator
MNAAKHTASHLALQFLRATRSVEEHVGLAELPYAARDILGFIADANSKGKPPRVTDVVKTHRFGTPPTTYGHIETLEKEGWISAKANPEDGRSKVLLVTPRAVRFYARVSSEMKRIVAGDGTEARAEGL